MELLKIEGKREIPQTRCSGEETSFRFLVDPNVTSPEIWVKIEHGEMEYTFKYSLREDRHIFLLTTWEQYDILPYRLNCQTIDTVVAGFNKGEAIEYTVGKLLESPKVYRVPRGHLQLLETSLRAALEERLAMVGKVTCPLCDVSVLKNDVRARAEHMLNVHPDYVDRQLAWSETVA